jgi:hypothetical protein
VKGTRELVSPPYVVVYRSSEEIVEILHIWHGRKTGHWADSISVNGTTGLAEVFYVALNRLDSLGCRR